jgi:hypothetical protein
MELIGKTRNGFEIWEIENQDGDIFDCLRVVGLNGLIYWHRREGCSCTHSVFLIENELEQVRCAILYGKCMGQLELCFDN